MRLYCPVVWWGTAVEVYSAIARSMRTGLVDAVEAQLAASALEKIQSTWRRILPDDDVQRKARTLLDLYPLRAADALQLAAALTWCRDRPTGRTFLCGDKRLADAVQAAGFTVLLL